MDSDVQVRVAAAVWPWRESVATGADSAGARRKHAVIEASIMLAVALALLLVFEKPVLACVVTSLAVLVLVGGLVYPPLYHGFKKLGGWLAKGVGVGLAWLLLVPFFYLCFATGRLILLIARKDPMQRAFPGQEESFWTPRRPVSGPEHYSRQY